MLVGAIIGIFVTLGIFTFVTSNPPAEENKSAVVQQSERFYHSKESEVQETKLKQEEEKRAKAELAKAQAELAKAEKIKADIALAEKVKADFIQAEKQRAEQARRNAELAKLELAKAKADLERTKLEIASGRVVAAANTPAPSPVAPPAEVEPRSTAAVEDVPVKVESLPSNTVASNLAWGVQVASMKSQDEAAEKVKSLEKLGFSSYIEEASVNGKSYYRVKLGPVATKAEAQALKEKASQYKELSGAYVSKKN